MTSAHQKAAQMLAAAADLLDQGQIVNRLSIAVTAIAIAVMLLPVFPASGAFVPAAALVTIAGLAEILLAIRVGFDAALFRRMANDATAERLDLSAVDNALVGLRLMAAEDAGRTLAHRFAGAKRFLILQGVAMLIQAVLAIAAGALLLLEWV